LGWRRHSLARIIGYAKLKTQNSKLKTLLPMSIVVQKYGGSSVADAQKLKRVAERVMQTSASGHAVVVVVSAMGDTTDDLLALAKTISPNPDRRELDMLLSAGERISMALLSMAIRELGGDAISLLEANRASSRTTAMWMPGSSKSAHSASRTS
jgi:aspartokinase